MKRLLCVAGVVINLDKLNYIMPVATAESGIFNIVADITDVKPVILARGLSGYTYAQFVVENIYDYIDDYDGDDTFITMEEFRDLLEKSKKECDNYLCKETVEETSDLPDSGNSALVCINHFEIEEDKILEIDYKEIKVGFLKSSYSVVLVHRGEYGEETSALLTDIETEVEAETIVDYIRRELDRGSKYITLERYSK